MQSKLAQLKDVVAEAKQKQAKFIYTIGKHPELPENEIIISPIANADQKLKDFEEIFDESLRLKINPDIQIIDFGYSHDISNDAIQ
ncbi:TPA: hypothetical protein ROY08_001373 [Bacillus cereus]|nr:hypothetical protein [Bacillus cereus]